MDKNSLLAQFEQFALFNDSVGTTADTSASVIHDGCCQAGGKVTYKYILIEVKDNRTNERKLIVRGSETSKYHSDILDSFNCKYFDFSYLLHQGGER